MTREGSSAVPGRRTVLAGLLLAAVAMIVWTSVASGDESGSTASQLGDLNQLDPSVSTIGQDGYDFDLSTFAWDKPSSEDEGAILTLRAGQAERLKDCGSNGWDESVLVLAPGRRAYCIAPVDNADPELMAAVRVAAVKLIDGGTWTDAELNYLRLQVLASYAGDSPDAAQIWGEFKAAGDALTPAEREHVSS